MAHSADCFDDVASARVVANQLLANAGHLNIDGAVIDVITATFACDFEQTFARKDFAGRADRSFLQKFEFAGCQIKGSSAFVCDKILVGIKNSIRRTRVTRRCQTFRQQNREPASGALRRGG